MEMALEYWAQVNFVGFVLFHLLILAIFSWRLLEMFGWSTQKKDLVEETENDHNANAHSIQQNYTSTI